MRFFSAVCGAAYAAGPNDNVATLLAQSRAALGGSALDRIKLLELHRGFR